MPSLTPFLPPHWLRHLARRKRLPPAPAAARVKTALLLADVSGFTDLTERLQERGREGAETIAAIINRAFRPAVRAIESQGGSILGFGGDAISAIFPGRSSVRRAELAAIEIRRGIVNLGTIVTSAGGVTLGISQAIHFGSVHELHLGTDRRRHYLPAGPSVTALARLEKTASCGDIVMSGAARRQRAGEGTPRVRKWTHAAPNSRILRLYLDPNLAPLLGKRRGEYRLATVLFLETKGYSLTRLNTFFVKLVDVLESYGGVLLKTDLSIEGVKWMTVFGIPKAHERDADRAARVALEMMAAGVLRVRGGLHSGTVVNLSIGTASRRSLDVMGDVVNTAARVTGEAAWGEALVTEETRQRLTGVTTRRRGRRKVKGKAASLSLHCLLKARSSGRKLGVTSKLIGRNRELGLIVAALRRAAQGEGSVIAIEGDAGIGKSRLGYESALRARTMGMTVYEGQAVAFGGTAFHAIKHLLKRPLRLTEGADSEEVLSRVSKAASRLKMQQIDADHLAAVWGAHHPDSSIAHLKTEQVRQNSMIAVRNFCRALSRIGPHLLILEDLHWAGPETAEAIRWIAGEAERSAFVLLLIHRKGYDPPAEALRTTLGALSRGSMEKLLADRIGNVAEDVGRLVLQRAAGNPFYLEELLRHMLDSGILLRSQKRYRLVREVRAEDVPETIESLIAARLDSLGADARRVAHEASVVGRVFPADLIRKISGPAATRGIAELLSHELILKGGSKKYVFMHALTRDVAYATLLAQRRRRLHRKVANELEKLPKVETRLALLGHHRESAGQSRLARKAYLAGARHAVASHAQGAAERLYKSYFTLTRRTSAESSDARNEFGADVLQRQGRMKEAEAAHRQALAEARSIGGVRRQGLSFRHLGTLYWKTGRIREAQRSLAQSLRIAQKAGDIRGRGLALRILADLNREQGRMGLARRLFKRSLRIARKEGNKLDEGMVLGSLAILEREQGRMEEASRLYKRALAIHRRMGNLRSEGIVLGNMAAILMRLGRLEEAEELHDQALTVHRKVGNRRGEGIVLSNLANLLRERGRVGEALALYDHALAIAHETGNLRGQAHLLRDLAGLHQDRGQMERAEELYEESLAIHRRMGDRNQAGLLLNDLAGLCHDQGVLREARALYKQALAIFREVSNKEFEGVVLGNLASILNAKGQRTEAWRLFEEARAIHREVKSRRSEGIVILNQAILLMDQGRMREAGALFEEALAIHREVGNRRLEAITLGFLARWEAFTKGTMQRAIRYERNAEEVLSALGDKRELAMLLVFRGHNALAKGSTAAPFLKRARQLGREASAAKRSGLRIAIKRLHRAKRRFKSGAALVAGYCPEDLPAEWLAWLRDHRPEALAG